MRFALAVSREVVPGSSWFETPLDSGRPPVHSIISNIPTASQLARIAQAPGRRVRQDPMTILNDLLVSAYFARA